MIRKFVFLFTALWISTACAQQAAQLKIFASSAEVQELIAKARKAPPANPPVVTQTLLQLAPYRAALEYRTGPGAAATHEKEAEIFYVAGGAGTLVTGGRLVNGKRTNAENLNGTAIEGGDKQALAKGDFVFVPENTAHWFSEVQGELILVSMHVPRAGSGR